MTSDRQGDSGLTTRASLLRRARDLEDRAAWTELDRIYRRLIRAAAMRQGLSATEADDIAQETLMTLVRVLPRFDYAPARCRFRGWLREQTERRVFDHLRRRRVQVAAGVDSSDTRRTAIVERLPDPGSLQPDAVWDRDWQQQVIERALDKLRRTVRPLHYQVFYLYAIKGQSSLAVARSLGVGIGQVYVLKHRTARTFKRLAELARKELDGERCGGP